MEPSWLSAVELDPTWIGIVAGFGALGASATVVMLVRQREPRARTDREQLARRREPRREPRRAH